MEEPEEEGSMGKAEAGHGPELDLEGLERQVWNEDFILVAWDSLVHRDSKPVTPFLFTSQDRKSSVSLKSSQRLALVCLGHHCVTSNLA